MVRGFWLTNGEPIVAACLIMIIGCGGDSRQSLQGSVTHDDEPLASGYISFTPQSGTPGPTAGNEIADGRFSIARARGTFPGTFRVEVTASRPSGRKVEGVPGEVYEQFFPARYNKESELSAEVLDGGENDFEFALTED